MKIVCESCGAKYSIADEKVAGKVFKIRCKKCSAVIVVKGDQQQQPTDEVASAAPEAGDAAWHVVVAGEQQGPFAPRQIGELLAEGKIDWEAYVWREGMDNWQPAKDVESLVKAVMSESEGSGAAAMPTGGGEVFGGSSDMGADPFASSDDGGLSGVIGQPAASSVAASGVDLFADSGRSAFAAAGDDEDSGASRNPSGGTSPKVSEAQSMTGQRNENSVLFSLSNLQALATGSGAAPTPARAKPGMAQGEGSGLIDIRALATATQAVTDRPNGGSRDKVEDLLAVGATNTTFSSTALASPVAVEKPDHSKTLLYGMAAAILLLGGVVTYLATRSDPQPTAQLTPAAEATPTGAAATTANTPPSAPQAAEPAPAQAAANEPSPSDDRQAQAPTEEDEGNDRERSSRRSRDRDRDRDKGEKSEKSEKPEKSETVAAAPSPEPKKSTSGDRSLDDLLDTALGAKPKAAAPAPKPAGESLPATPSRDDVLSAMKGVTSKVQACGAGQTGIAMTKVGVAGPTGKVSSVDVGGAFAGTPAASCISKEVMKAKFPKFSQATFSFSYPFKI
jgi:predicted Zn finger-like uncharacterized protein